MKKNRKAVFVLAISAMLFIAAGCAQTVKKEESVQKSAEPSSQVQAPQPEEKAVAKEEAPAPQKEEKVAEQPIQEEVQTAKAAKESAVKDEVSEMVERQGRLLTIYFDFDRFTIRDDMKPVLEKDAEWLKKNPGIKIQVQGHCDERGTNEYNIALGERRARSIKEYLINYGINQLRLSTISYGEEKPADPGHTEEAWAKNRRGELVIVKK
ncbi:MAG: peptidoglycan-associated lipoprotein Pal [Deltaproteobacteria bacterium]|nr:peptidoglycan-associated lipoprotein Pal [Deltaproteobacteria bacterium]